MNYLVRESLQPSATRRIAIKGKEVSNREIKTVEEVRLVTQVNLTIKKVEPLERSPTPKSIEVSTWYRREYVKNLAGMKQQNYSQLEITEILENGRIR